MSCVLHRHFEHLYARSTTELDGALQALLPPGLSDSRVLAFRSSAFLTAAGLDRLLARVRCATKGLGQRGSALRILDLGCGRGRVCAHLAELFGATLTGIDFAESAIAAARIEGPPEATFVNGDVRDLPFDDGSFDIVIAVDTLHLVEGLAEVIQEVRRVLDHRGAFLGTAYRLSGSAGCERTLDSWRNLIGSAGFSQQDWLDVTSEWRLEMQGKHTRRWERRETLLRLFGASAAAECDVSSQMLGLGGREAFIVRNERWEFSATA